MSLPGVQMKHSAYGEAGVSASAAVATKVNGAPQGLCWSTERLIWPLLFIEVSKIVAE